MRGEPPRVVLDTRAVDILLQVDAALQLGEGGPAAGAVAFALLNGAIADTPDIPESIDFYVSNDTDEGAAGGSFRLVAAYSPTDRTVRVAQSPPPIAARYSFIRTFDLRGQRWRTQSSFSPDAVAAELLTYDGGLVGESMVREVAVEVEGHPGFAQLVLQRIDLRLELVDLRGRGSMCAAIRS